MIRTGPCRRRRERTTMRRSITALLLVVAIAGAPLALAQTKPDDVTDLQALRQVVKNDKRAYVESMLKLSDAEAKRFWPIYDGYQREVDLNNRRRNVALQELMFRDTPMTNLAAKHYVAELLAVDEAEIKARRTMRNRVMRALPAVKAARYMQLEE